MNHILLAYPFRPFFLLCALYAAATVFTWAAVLFIGWQLPLGWTAVGWHAHEMLFGVVPAAIAGFLLTAMCNWTGAAPMHGAALLALVLLWLAGRLVMWTAAALPPHLVALVDGIFIPVVALYAYAVLLRHRNSRNYVLVATLALLSVANVVMHIGFATGGTDLLARGQLLGMDAVAMLVVIIAGRITPAFSRNWLKLQGRKPDVVVMSPRSDRWALYSVAALALATQLPLPAPLIGMVALAAAAANGYRLLQWSGWHTAREPLLWILHLAYAWLVLALVLRGLAGLLPGVGNTWVHAFGAGAVGSLLVGVMTRVALGHTGRPLTLPPYGLVCYAAIIAAALLRILVAEGWVDYRLGLSLSALAWVLGFGLYAVLYWPILSQPRPDGRPG